MRMQEAIYVVVNENSAYHVRAGGIGQNIGQNFPCDGQRLLSLFQGAGSIYRMAAVNVM